MQSQNQVVMLGVFFKKSEKTVDSNCSADRVRKRDCHPTLLLQPGLQTLFFTFTMLSMSSPKMELIW